MLLKLIVTISLFVFSVQGVLVFIQEELPPGAMVLQRLSEDISVMESLTPEEVSSATFAALHPNQGWAPYFQVDAQTGTIYQAKRLDREQICNASICPIGFEITLRQGSLTGPLLKVVNVTVLVSDVNDNSLAFPQKNVHVTVSEDAPMGTVIFCSRGAVDPDLSPHNSIVDHYEIQPPQPFSLIVKRDLEGDEVCVQLAKLLDREAVPAYRLNIIAKGKENMGDGLLRVDVIVTDVNDNAPFFSQLEYNFQVARDSPVGTVIGMVMAMDADSGRNGQLRYSIQPRNGLFSVDAYRGTIMVVGNLSGDADVYTMTVQVSDSMLSSQAKVNIQIVGGSSTIVG